jgi:LacI family transcriptional regulator
MPKTCRVAVILPLSATYDRLVLHGAIDWMRSMGGVEMFSWPNLHHSGGPVPQGLRDHLRSWIRQFSIRGLVTNIWAPEALDWLSGLGIPVLDVGGTWPESRIAGIHVDNAAVGRLAARHLLDKGLRDFAFCGRNVPLHSCQRRDAFVAEIAAAGFPCQLFEEDISFVPSTLERERPLRRWLNSLPKPVGLLCWFDYWAMCVQHVCRRIGIHIPEEIALVGVDNDELICHQCPVPITSIDVGARNIGYKAMELLDRMIRKGYRPRRHLLLPPGNVISRQSSDILAVDNPDIAEAMRFIQANAARCISVTDVLAAVPISRRGLEVQFRRLFGRSPRQEIQRAHVEVAKNLLEKYDLGMAQVAEASGFNTPPAFSLIFKRMTGVTPGQYRRQLLRPKPVERRE